MYLNFRSKSIASSGGWVVAINRDIYHVIVHGPIAVEVVENWRSIKLIHLICGILFALVAININ
jgi:hypothetical protein